MREATDVILKLPAHLIGSRRQATILSYDADRQTVPVEIEGQTARLILPRLRLWSVVVLDPPQ
jgi:hypothetical protein